MHFQKMNHSTSILMFAVLYTLRCALRRARWFEFELRFYNQKAKSFHLVNIDAIYSTF